MDHLTKKGGVFEERDRMKRVDRQVPMICEYHYSVPIYLEELYKDYHGPGEVNNFFTLLDLAFCYFLILVFTKLHSGIKHEGLCKKDDNYHKKARVVIDRGKEKEKLQLCEENVRLANEVAMERQKIAQLQNISKDLFEKAARLESEMEKLGIAKKEKRELTEIEMR
jgi:hypothetical protein